MEGEMTTRKTKKNMNIAISADKMEGVAGKIEPYLKARGYTVIKHGALQQRKDRRWAFPSSKAAEDVANGKADLAIVCCHTGTGASIAANKIPMIRAALCVDAYTAAGARKWNDANVLALSLRLTSEKLLEEILEAWLNNSSDGTQKDDIDFLNRG